MKSMLSRLMQASLICCLALMITGCDEFLSDNPISPHLWMNETPMTMKVGDTYTRKARAHSDAVVAYSSSDETVATVDNKGTVTALAEGTTTITAFTTGQDKEGGISYTQESVSYLVTVEKAVDPMLSTPLTFEAKTAGAVVTFKASTALVAASAKDIEYSTDGGTTWTAGNTGGTGVSVTLTNIGDKVMFRGTNDRYSDITPNSYYNKFSCTEDCYIYGNMMSLINKDNFATNKELTARNAFAHMFYNNAHIVNHDTKTLELPATTLTEACYFEMFAKCTALTSAPKLPATTLADACYQEMFEACTALTTAPELPATTLTGGCYYCMFQDCTALTTAPELPATTLAINCYSGMFYGCTALTNTPELPATTLADGCYFGMFYGCTALTNTPELPATTLADACYYGMFAGCLALTAAPELPATTLADGCYYGMFEDCTALTTAPKLPATTLVKECYCRMFKGCTSLTQVWVKANYTNANGECTKMFKDCTDAATSTFYSDDAANWKTAFTTELGSWATAAYPAAP